jgi:hypothetical protein
MTDRDDLDGPNLTIVGGQPSKRRGRKHVVVPVGLEKLLYRAASDTAFKALLLENVDAAAQEAGIELRDSERATLSNTSASSLEYMIGSIVPSNPKKRKFMNVVAVAVTSLAAGTALLSCGEEGDVKTRGITGDMDADADADTDADTDTDTDYDYDGGADGG